MSGESEDSDKEISEEVEILTGKFMKQGDSGSELRE